MKQIKNILLGAIMLLALAGFSQPVMAMTKSAAVVPPQTYTVMVGAEDPSQGIVIEDFFLKKLRVHVGDTVNWQQNSFEIHTVTFLAGTAQPELLIPSPVPQVSPLMFNPAAAFPTVPAGGLYDGSTYVNSGVMSKAPGQPTSFSLTFTKAGTYDYLCLVHGVMMSGQVVVVDPSIPVLSPDKVSKVEANQIKDALAAAQPLIAQAEAAVPAPTLNADGTTTYHVMMGYMSGDVDLMRFFPSTVNAHPGDQIQWSMPAIGEAPHTITFLNGNPEPELIMPYFVPPSGPLLLLINTAALIPANLGLPLDGTHFFHSGLLQPGPNTTYTKVVGNFTGTLDYICILHDDSGMHAVVNVTPR